MSFTKSTFNRLPSCETLAGNVTRNEAQLKDLTTYMWFLIPLEEKFGERVYEIASKSLNSQKIEVTADQLKALAKDIKDPRNKEKYTKERLKHMSIFVTSVKL